MATNEELAELLFPDVTETIDPFLGFNTTKFGI